MERLISKTKGDRWIWLIVILLSVWSLLAVYSATGTLAYKKGVGSEQFLIKHLVMIVGGIALMYFSHLLDYRYYAGISKVLMVITIPLLAYTLIFGASVNEASRWVTIPIINQTFQTSDLAKLALITFLARTLSKKQENIKDVKKAFLPIMAAVCAVFVLIALANLSTALMLFGVSILLLIMGRISIKQISIVCLAGVVLLGAVMMLGPRRKTYISRIDTFIHPEKADPDKAFQANQAKIAIATGGIFGKGPGNSTQRNFLPHPYSDFVFALIIEEYGMVGGVGLVLLYLLFLYRCVLIVTDSPKAFGALLAAGLSFSLTIQAFANMAVAVGLGPVTGVPLPLVSMGGTSILFTSVAFGIILSVSRDIEEKKNKSKEKVIIGEIPAMG
ncbi:MAG: cell division protein FtsW [Sphingobacteriales bacterium 17-39-43]|jgi:cell division protein FtsW|uniref:FtsW/RodA/SpoVE family cell cycle protein n=1 Tax=Daejeonella sp. TaxID=2805397 RepID=UPI000BCD65A9|nr:FtsW/RodA/SpoVE family cell cycle protein [Daejeonella sp.]OYY05926.1 MAG: cell division protein FtsW [Sphingobacteriia bacterium 35-40-5]OYZ29085.1 MAG: cell division protein FtsW [Sphingobacteriales bacterium 16-39-50]OZA23090.1 MAG: cell division protein FtsW [Sphingobacteriales bacterium 17-39-43]OZA62268.1 MAG: cell division protein FtsW [Sphingobacteriales bacterium 39-40-5]HQS50334.1 FtsW/RodA/SpoVE family cell cycle protein [Daejeonella sp.]